MRKRISLLCLIAAFLLVLTACNTEKPAALDTPVVTVDENGIATWPEVSNATGYVYKIDGGEEQPIDTCFVKLINNQTIVVKAVGDGTTYLDSAESQPVTFVMDLTDHTHSYRQQVIAPTCQTAGYTLYSCDCGETYENSATPVDENAHLDADKNGTCELCNLHFHYYTVTVTPATCQAQGYTLHTCSCGDTFKDGVTKIDANAHIDDNKDGTCDLCQDHAHSYTTSVTPPTCTQEGYTTYTCQCKYSYVADKVPALGKHTDENKDKLCDLCRLSVIVELDFYSVNDLHGAFLDTSTHPGVDEFTTYMKKKYQDTSSYEILLSAGDMWQGSVESSSNKGALMTEWMNELDFAAMTLGNHEYDWGSSYITKNARIAEFPFLGINIQENGSRPSYCKPSATVERGGVKIGIIGAMGNHLSSISGEFTGNLSFITGRALTQLVKDEATRLREKEGCDLIIYVIHNDDTGYDVSLSKGYVDVVFEGHTHQSYVNQDANGVVHIQAGGYNEGISFVNIAYNLAEDTFAVEEKRNIYSSVYGASSIADDPAVNRIFKKYFAVEDPYNTVLGTTSKSINSKTICQEVAKQYLAFGQQHWSNYDIVLGGGYLKLRDPYNLSAGNITYAKLFTLMPFDNSLVLGKISGAKLKSKFINNSSYYKETSDLLPARINDNETYYIVVDTYTAYYASNGITIVDRYDNYYARDIIADFVRSGGWSN